MTPKSKMISFRISDEEYSRLKEACSILGIDSISEAARAATKRLVDAHPREGAGVKEQLRDLRSKLYDIALDVDRLDRTLESK